jgi:hypothetical protein
LVDFAECRGLVPGILLKPVNKKVLNMKKALNKNVNRIQATAQLNSVNHRCFICSIIRLPLTLLFFLIRIFFLGPKPNSFIKWGANVNPETLLSGFVMTISSVTTFFFLGDLGKYLDSLEWLGDFTGIVKGIIVISLLIQFIRGLSFLGGIDVFPIHGTIGNTMEFHNGIYRGNQFGPDIKGAFKTSKKSNIREFTEYMDSKMSIMSNPQKEKYLKDFFSGK